MFVDKPLPPNGVDQGIPTASHVCFSPRPDHTLECLCVGTNEFTELTRTSVCMSASALCMRSLPIAVRACN